MAARAKRRAQKAEGTKGARQRTSSGANRPVLLPASEEMKHWAALLGGEVETWPDVSTRPMFGFVSYYRGKQIFAALPKTRTMGSPNSFIFKVGEGSPLKAKARSDPRIDSADLAKARWLTFAISSEGDLRDALRWLDRAYLAASKRQ